MTPGAARRRLRPRPGRFHLRTTVHAHSPESMTRRRARGLHARSSTASSRPTRSLRLLAEQRHVLRPAVQPWCSATTSEQPARSSSGIGNYTGGGLRRRWRARFRWRSRAFKRRARDAEPERRLRDRRGRRTRTAAQRAGARLAASKNGGAETDGRDRLGDVACRAGRSASPDKIGAVAPGLEADLIAVEGDPASNIRALEKGPCFVMKDGRVFQEHSRYALPVCDRFSGGANSDGDRSRACSSPLAAAGARSPRLAGGAPASVRRRRTAAACSIPDPDAGVADARHERKKAQLAAVDQFRSSTTFTSPDRREGERHHLRPPHRGRRREDLQGGPLRPRQRDRRGGRGRRRALRTSTSSTRSAATSSGRTSAAAGSRTSRRRPASRWPTGSASRRRSPTSTTTATRTSS